MSEPDPIKIKDYQIHFPPLGEGTFGTVYRATYRSISDRALKIFHPGAVDIVTMARELEKLSKVAEHNGIVTLHDFDLLNEPRYYAMGIHADLMPDGTWQTRTLERLCGHVDYQEAWRLIREIADAVSYLHRNHIVHCDLKPSNILLTDEAPNHIKICDFGQSRGLHAENFEPAGTPLYASPEQLRAPSDSADGKGFRWDVYSFGVVAYKLLTGDLPRLQNLAKSEKRSFDTEATLSEDTLQESGNELDGENLANMIEAVEEIEWPDNFYIPSARKLLIERCLSIDPAKRPADMREVWSLIQEKDHQRVVQQARRLNIVFALLLVAAIWATIFAFTQAGRARESSDEAMISSKQAEQLALIFINEFNQSGLAGVEADKIYSIVADHSETFLASLPKNRQSETTLRISAQTAAMRGRQAMDEGKLDEALNKYKNAYEIRSKLGGRNLEFLAVRDLMQIGLIYEKQGQLLKAVETFLKARDWWLEDSSHHEEFSASKVREFSSTYFSLAEVYLKSGESKKAIETLAEIVSILGEKANELTEKQTVSLQREIMPILSRMGEMQYRARDLKGARDSFSNLQAMANKISVVSPNLQDEARGHLLTAIHFLGQILLDRDARDEAVLLFREEIRLRDQIMTRRPYDPELKIGLASAYGKAARCLENGQRSLGIFYLEQAISLISSLPPEFRNIPTNIALSEDYRAQLNSLLEKDE